jgi:hypothetical protein
MKFRTPKNLLISDIPDFDIFRTWKNGLYY